MKRRNLLQLPLALLFAAPSRAGLQPWSAQLLKGGFDGKHYWAGLAISLAPKWKTYWRVPGDGGIAPQIDILTENVGSQTVHYPLPTRFEDEAGMTIGYKEEVVFPISLLPTDEKLPIKVSLKAFFGVCEIVCVPAQFDGEVTFDPAKSDAPDQQLISQWQAKVPVMSLEGPFIKASAEVSGGKPVLVLDALEQVTDIFVEGNPMHYFGKPDATSGFIRIPVSGAKSADELKGKQVRITINKSGRALEQSMPVR
jgi:DsbC/DsbD-like thiol-disulfide interchange protein